MSLISRLIRNADEELRYPNSNELEQMESFFRAGGERLKIAEQLSEQEENIIDAATQAFQTTCPNVTLDYAPYLRRIIYRVVAGEQELASQLDLQSPVAAGTSLSPEEKQAGLYCLREAVCNCLGTVDGFEPDIYFENLMA